MAQLRWTSKDLLHLPLNEGKRYEIIDGELYVTHQPSLEHQSVCGRLNIVLGVWNNESKLGVVYPAPGIIFPDDDNVVPDLVWVSRESLALLAGPDGKLHGAPELVIEVLSPGSESDERDRDMKLKLYSRRGAREYWIVDWQRRQVEVHRRQNAALVLAATLAEDDNLTSPLLPGFAARVSELFADLGTQIEG